jgi:hypothetical protein
VRVNQERIRSKACPVDLYHYFTDESGISGMDPQRTTIVPLARLLYVRCALARMLRRPITNERSLMVYE